jgi:hypothetical protein
MTFEQESLAATEPGNAAPAPTPPPDAPGLSTADNRPPRLAYVIAIAVSFLAFIGLTCRMLSDARDFLLHIDAKTYDEVVGKIGCLLVLGVLDLALMYSATLLTACVTRSQDQVRRSPARTRLTRLSNTIHRSFWKIASVAIGFVALHAIQLGVYAYGIKKSERLTLQSNVHEVAEAGSALRGSLLMFENTCDDVDRPECVKWLDEIRVNYFRYSWGAPALMHMFKQFCQSAPADHSSTRRAICACWRYVARPNVADDNNDCLECTAQDAEEKKIVKCSSLTTSPKGSDTSSEDTREGWMVNSLNQDFRDYMNKLARCPMTDSACIEARRTAAETLYEDVRIAQCAIAEVEHQQLFFNEAKQFQTYASCVTPKWRGPVSTETLSSIQLDWKHWPRHRQWVKGASGKPEQGGPP